MHLGAEADVLRRKVAISIYVAIDGKAAGILAIADPVKATPPEAFRCLQADGIRVVMRTGNNQDGEGVGTEAWHQ